MGHTSSDIYEHYYRNDVVDADIVAAVLEKPSDQAAMRLMGHVSLTRDPNAPCKLTKSERQEASNDAEVQAAAARYATSVAALRADHVTVSAARREAGKDPELQRRVDENDNLRKEYNKIRARKETELLEHLRAQYFATLGDVCLENQYTGQEEPAGPAPPIFRFGERKDLAKLLFPLPDTKTPSCVQQIQNGCQIIRLYASLCSRREYPRLRRQPKHAGCDPEKSGPDITTEGDLDIAPCFVDTCPGIFPVQCPGTQCLFCLGDGTLSTDIRTRCFSSTYALTRHVKIQHLKHLRPGMPFVCPHPTCQVTKIKCRDGNGFKVHALQVHNVIHGQ